MVLHGSVNYTGEAVNLSAYPEQSVLRAIENGESLLFTLAAQNSEALLQSDRTDCFSVDYAGWKERLLSYYGQMKPIAEKTAGSGIQKHEYVQKDVARVEYENGTVVAVNYTDHAVTVDGVNVEDCTLTSLRNHIAVWDTIHSCSIEGSSDSSIRDVVPNDLASILDHASIQAIYTNGGLSGKMYDRFCRKQTGIEAVKLPSTSPANAAWNLDRLTDAWKCINQILGEPGSETKSTVSDGNTHGAKTRTI